MVRCLRLLTVLIAVGVALGLGSVAWVGRDAAAGSKGIRFEEARIFFEFNSTANDLGVQVFLDGEAWKRLKILDPSGQRLLTLQARGHLGKLGLTELFFESDEPTPEEVLDLFPAGKYKFEGKTVEGEEIEGRAVLSHDLPAAPVILTPSAPGEVIDRSAAVIRWAAVPDIASYEIIVENEDVGAEMTVPLPASATTLHVPVEFLEPNTGYKVEVLAIAENGNKTITEREFVTGP